MKLLSSNLIQLTKILSDLQYHDGDTIGMQLNVTRSAVWKIIKKLQEYGIEIDSIKNKGYALKEPLLLLDQQLIAKEIANPNIAIEVLECAASTNSYLRSNITNYQRRICFAEMQTAGKGRMSRSWHSPFGQNIYMSYAYPFKKDISDLAGLSLVVGMACINAIKEILPEIEMMLKWPNDGLYLGEKLMGNLIELQAEANGEALAIIGVGINVNMLTGGDISQKWSSLRKINGHYIDRNRLAIALIHNLNAYLEQFSKYGLRDFLAQWHRLDYLYGQSIALNDGEMSGIAKGVNEQGNLLLELVNGETQTVSAGDASVCK